MNQNGIKIEDIHQMEQDQIKVNYLKVTQEN